MRHHQHKGLYIALKLGGAAVATAAVATSYVYFKQQNEAKAAKNKAFLELNHEAGRLNRLNQQYDRQSAGSNFHNFGGGGLGS